MELRTYAWAKGEVEDTSKTELPDHPMIETAWAVINEIAKDAREARHG